MNTCGFSPPEACESMYVVRIHSFGLGESKVGRTAKVGCESPCSTLPRAKFRSHGTVDDSTLAEIWQECVNLRNKHTESNNQSKTDNACPEGRADNLCCRRQGQGLQR